MDCLGFTSNRKTLMAGASIMAVTFSEDQTAHLECYAGTNKNGAPTPVEPCYATLLDVHVDAAQTRVNFVRPLTVASTTSSVHAITDGPMFVIAAMGATGNFSFPEHTDSVAVNFWDPSITLPGMSFSGLGLHFSSNGFFGF